MTISANQLVTAAISQGLIDEALIETLRRDARRERISLLDALTTHQRFPMLSLYQAWSAEQGIAFIPSRDLHCDMTLVKKIPPALLVRKRLLPCGNVGVNVRVAAADPTQPGLEGIQQLLGMPVE